MEVEPEHVNPFASPLTEEAYQPADVNTELDDVRGIRREYLAREASIKSIGTLYVAGAVLMTLVIGIGMFGALWRLASGGGAVQLEMLDILEPLLVVSMTAVSWWIGLGMRRLNPAVRITTIAFSALGLLAFPFGTIINGYIIWMLASKKGKYVFSPEYKEVIAQTQDMKYRTSAIAWVVLAVLILLIIALVISVAAATPLPIRRAT